MTTPAKRDGWTAPNVIVSLLGMVMMVIGSYLAIQRSTSDATVQDIRDLDRKMTAVQTQLNDSAATRDTARARRDQELIEVRARLGRLEERQQR